MVEQYGKETNLEWAPALFFWLVFLFEDSQGLKRNCSAKSHLCPCPLCGTQKLTRKRCQAMEVSMSTLGEKNSSCYFLLRDLGVPSSKTSPLRLTICCFWTCSKTLLLIRTVEKLVVRQPCSLDTLECPVPRGCLVPARGCARLLCLRGQEPVASTGSSSGCPTLCVRLPFTGGFYGDDADGAPIHSGAECKMSPPLALPVEFCSII